MVILHLKRSTWIAVGGLVAAGAVLAAEGQPTEPPDISVSRLVTSLARWEFWGYVSAAAVAIGVIGESIHEFSHWFSQHPSWKVKGGKASALLLIVALVAEVVIQVKANSLSGQIIALLSNQAAEATLKAGKLGVTVDNLHAFVEEKEKSAAEQIDAFRKFAGNEKVQTEALITELAHDKASLDQMRRDAQAAARSAETTLAAFRKETSPRSMSADQRRLFIGAIKGKIGSVIVESLPDRGDDSYPYALEIVAALKAAGVDAKYQIFPIVFFSILQKSGDPGLIVWEFGEAATAPGHSVLSAFAAAGIAAGEALQPLEGNATPHVVIVVAPRPLPAKEATANKQE